MGLLNNLPDNRFPFRSGRNSMNWTWETFLSPCAFQQTSPLLLSACGVSNFFSPFLLPFLANLSILSYYPFHSSQWDDALRSHYGVSSFFSYSFQLYSISVTCRHSSGKGVLLFRSVSDNAMKFKLHVEVLKEFMK